LVLLIVSAAFASGIGFFAKYLSKWHGFFLITIFI